MQYSLGHFQTTDKSRFKKDVHVCWSFLNRDSFLFQTREIPNNLLYSTPYHTSSMERFSENFDLKAKA